MPRKASFERWTVERYRREMGLPAPGTPDSPGLQASINLKGPLRRRTSGSRKTAGPSATSRCARGLLASGLPSEEQIHRDCADWVFRHEEAFPVLRWLMHVPNGGHRSRGEAGKMRAMGVRPGVVDWIHPMRSPGGRYPGLAIEVKSARGVLSDDQQDFLADAAEDGWLTGVARTVEEFVELVQQWLEDRT